RVHHRSALELVGDQRALELVARVDEERLAPALPRVAANGVHPAAQPLGAADRIARPGGERPWSRRREQRAVDVVDSDDDEAARRPAHAPAARAAARASRRQPRGAGWGKTRAGGSCAELSPIGRAIAAVEDRRKAKIMTAR